jgi:hypothetical protein
MCVWRTPGGEQPRGHRGPQSGLPSEMCGRKRKSRFIAVALAPYTGDRVHCFQGTAGLFRPRTWTKLIRESEAYAALHSKLCSLHSLVCTLAAHPAAAGGSR